MGSITGFPVYYNQLQQCKSEYAKRQACEFCFIFWKNITTFKIKRRLSVGLWKFHIHRLYHFFELRFGLVTYVCNRVWLIGQPVWTHSPGFSKWPRTLFEPFISKWGNDTMRFSRKEPKPHVNECMIQSICWLQSYLTRSYGTLKRWDLSEYIWNYKSYSLAFKVQNVQHAISLY